MPTYRDDLTLLLSVEPYCLHGGLQRLAVDLTRDKQTVYRWTTGKTRPSVEDAEAIHKLAAATRRKRKREARSDG